MVSDRRSGRRWFWLLAWTSALAACTNVYTPGKEGDWLRAQDVETAEFYRWYLQKYPDSEHAEEARVLAAALADSPRKFPRLKRFGSDCRSCVFVKVDENLLYDGVALDEIAGEYAEWPRMSHTVTTRPTVFENVFQSVAPEVVREGRVTNSYTYERFDPELAARAASKLVSAHYGQLVGDPSAVHDGPIEVRVVPNSGTMAELFDPSGLPVGLISIEVGDSNTVYVTVNEAFANRGMGFGIPAEDVSLDGVRVMGDCTSKRALLRGSTISEAGDCDGGTTWHVSTSITVYDEGRSVIVEEVHTATNLEPQRTRIAGRVLSRKERGELACRCEIGFEVSATEMRTISVDARYHRTGLESLEPEGTLFFVADFETLKSIDEAALRDRIKRRVDMRSFRAVERPRVLVGAFSLALDTEWGVFGSGSAAREECIRLGHVVR